jgi:hypothetical protein
LHPCQPIAGRRQIYDEYLHSHTGSCDAFHQP